MTSDPLCVCGCPASHHVVDIFGHRFEPPKTAEQLGVPCLTCDCDDFQSAASGDAAKLAEALRFAEQDARG